MIASFLLSLERIRAGLRRKSAEIEGLEMPYLEGGRGEPLLLIHGFGADKDNFTRLAGKLTGRYRVIIPDLPGFGEAGRDPSLSYAIADQVRRVAGFMAALGIARAQVGGNSMGGQIAVELAAAHPEKVAGLWLLAPAGTAAALDTEIIKNYAANGEMPLLVRTPRQMDAMIAVTMSRPPFMPRSLRRFLGRRACADRPLHSQIIARLFREPPSLDALGRTLPVRSVIVWGSEDRILNPRAAERMREILPNSEVVVLEGIGHVPMLEAPGRVAKLLLAHTP